MNNYSSRKSHQERATKGSLPNNRSSMVKVSKKEMIKTTTTTKQMINSSLDDESSPVNFPDPEKGSRTEHKSKASKAVREEVITRREEKRIGIDIAINKIVSKSKNTEVITTLQGKRGAEFDVADIISSLGEVTKKQKIGTDKGKKIVANETENEPTSLEPDEGTNKGLTKVVAVDCEMVMVRGNIHELARCSIVNYHGHVLFDKMIKPKGQITNYLTWVSGITPGHLKGAEGFEVYRAEILEILKGRIVVGHSVHNDFDALNYYPQDKNVRDLAHCKYLKKEGKLQSLKKMALEHLNIDIQKGQHDSIEDARATMAVYRKVEKQWEEDIKQSNYGMVRNQFLFDLNKLF